MNAWQFAQQIEHLLESVTWTGGDAVFGSSVYLYAGAVSENTVPPSFPFALVTIDAATPDPDEPELWEQTFSVATAVQVQGDPLGSHAIIGGSRPQLTGSAGAGVLEVSERVRSALQDLTSYDGAPVLVSSGGVDAPAPIAQGRHVVFASYTVVAICTSQPFYASPERLSITGEIAAWEGSWCSSRFDFLQYRFGWKLGTTPATSPDDLDTVVYTGNSREIAITRYYGRVYSVFADYDPRGTGSVAASSPSVLGSYKSL